MDDLNNLRAKITSEQRAILTAIWDYHLEKREWIRRRVLHHRFRELGKAGVRALLKELGGSVVFEVGSGEHEQYRLTLLGVLLSDQGQEGEDLLVKYLEYVRGQFNTNPEILRVDGQEVGARLGLTEQEAQGLFQLVQISGLWSNGAVGGGGQEWGIGIPHEVDELPLDIRSFVRERALKGYDPAVPIEESARITHFLEVPPPETLGRDIFIVHGRDDEGMKETVARFIERLGLNAIILHEQPNEGRTIIEKFVDYSNVGFAVALLTPDDRGGPRDIEAGSYRFRARQNVIFELGYFLGRLGRKRVCVLYREGVEIPSDYQGVLFVPLDDGGAWKLPLAREIKAAGFEVDLNRAF